MLQGDGTSALNWGWPCSEDEAAVGSALHGGWRCCPALHPTLRCCTRSLSAPGGTLPVISACAAAEPFSCCPSLGTPETEQSVGMGWEGRRATVSIQPALLQEWMALQEQLRDST